jgi:hypothetical protein
MDGSFLRKYGFRLGTTTRSAAQGGCGAGAPKIMSGDGDATTDGAGVRVDDGDGGTAEDDWDGDGDRDWDADDDADGDADGDGTSQLLASFVKSPMPLCSEPTTAKTEMQGLPRSKLPTTSGSETLPADFMSTSPGDARPSPRVITRLKFTT